MAKLSVFLPPFASDYTGVCSSLYDLGFLSVIADASCCTGHYAYYDEPRWEKSPRPIFSAQLHALDAVMGNDERLVRCVLDAARDVESDAVAVVGTPVPAITGMDLSGIACEIEARAKKPCLGFDTSGFETYDRGIIAAGRALIERFFKAEKTPPS